MGNSLVIDNSIVFELIVTNPLQTPVWVVDANVEVTLFEQGGTPVSGVAWPLILPYINLSEGVYRKTIPPIASLINGAIYKAVYKAVGSDGLVGEFFINIKAKE